MADFPGLEVDFVLHEFVCAVLHRAMMDVKQGRREAARWVLSSDAELYVGEAGIDYNKVRKLCRLSKRKKPKQFIE